MELLTCQLLLNESLYDGLRRLNRYGRMIGFPKTAISLQNLRMMLRVRPEVIHLTIACESYRSLASQSFSLLASTDDKLTRLPMHSQSSAPTMSRPAVSSSSSTCPHCNRKGHNELNCWKLHPEQKPSRGQLYQYLQEMMEEEQHMARPAGTRPVRPQREQKPGSSPRRTAAGRAGSAERLRRAPKPAHVLNQFLLYMSNPESEADIRNALMPPALPMTKSGQRDSLIQILWSNLLKTKIPIPASVLMAMFPNRQE